MHLEGAKEGEGRCLHCGRERRKVVPQHMNGELRVYADATWGWYPYVALKIAGREVHLRR